MSAATMDPRQLDQATRHLAFLAACAPDGHAQLELRIRTTSGMAQEWPATVDAAASLAARASDTTDVYVGAALRTGRDGTKNGVESVGVVWVDCDDAPAVAALAAFPVPASFVVESSPGKAHAYWRLTAPLQAADGEALNRALADHLGADVKCANRDRILRPAGTRNRKTGREGDPPRAPTPVHITGGTGAAVGPGALWAALPAPQVTPPPRAATTTTTGGEDRTRAALKAIPAVEYAPRITGREMGTDGMLQCPWHKGGQESTPSLHVRGPRPALWHCHGCDQGGDIFDMAGLIWDIDPRTGFPDLKRRLGEMFAVAAPEPHRPAEPLDASADGDATGPLRVRWLSDYEARPVDWLWRDRIPCAELTVLAGDGGFGKSTFAAHLAGEIATGRITGKHGTRRTLVVLGEDDPDRVLSGRYEAAGADRRLVGVVSAGPDDAESPLTLPADMERLRREVERFKPELLVIDPLSAHLAGDVDAHRDGGKGGLRQVLNPLSRLAQTTGTTVLVIVHLNKGQGPAGGRIAGSAAMRNAARNVLMLAPHPDHREGGEDDGRRILGHEKCNYGRMQESLAVTVSEAPVLGHDAAPLTDKDGRAVTTPVLHVGDVSDVDYRQALHMASDGARDDGEGSALDAAMSFLRDELAEGAVPAAELRASASGAGHAWKTVERAMSSLQVKSAKVGKTWVRELPVGGDGGLDETPAEMQDHAGSGAVETVKSANTPNVGGLGGLDQAPACRCGTPTPAPDPVTGRLRCVVCDGATTYGVAA